ncbi:MAG: hypothetical protein U0T74_05880 [Chitinophagales bacterium]
MKQIDLSQLGGHRFVKDDLRFMNDRVTVLMQGLTAVAPACILSGCVLTANGGTGTYHVSAGYVVIASELYRVEAADTGVSNSLNPLTQCFWNLVETVVSPSPVTYKNLTVKNIHKERKMTVSGNASIFAYGVIPKWEDVVLDKFKGEWHEVGASGETAYDNTWEGAFNYPLRYRKDGNNLVITGVAYNPTFTSGTSDVIFIIEDETLRPPHNLLFMMRDVDDSFNPVYILTTGEVRVSKTGMTADPLTCHFGTVIVPLS